LKKTFHEGLRKKLKLAIIGMPRVTNAKVANLTRDIEETPLLQIMVFQDVQVD
jgi:hypothetical protein